MTAFGDVILFAHDAIGPPGDQVGDANINAQIASGAGVDLHRFGRANGLDDVGISTLGFGPTKTRLHTVKIQRFWVFSFTTARSITPRHEKA